MSQPGKTAARNELVRTSVSAAALAGRAQSGSSVTFRGSRHCKSCGSVLRHRARPLLVFPILSFERKLTSADLAKAVKDFSPAGCVCGGGVVRAPASCNHREERLGCPSGTPQRVGYWGSSLRCGWRRQNYYPSCCSRTFSPDLFFSQPQSCHRREYGVPCLR